ncbi:ribonucleotide reductase subunit 2 [Equid gammaherpesvirus 5]|uniref:ribonucleoside-diphosphate reductase n=1 Tax=Equid gammaherpesvirus 5 TaxID=10371 RepID=A0A0B4Q636_9GAMA|nr:ribonucleotide reductase subunit 2 [Equid gammaherpesvirus 5]AIU39585.1 ribonucleotide reductase subunit 2 [Equid gammaherpesvirus 5]APT43404.1 ribonucleotide reductase subunit 2 [Equid gammaherpesvirus 5]UTK45496.1 ribonucleotide reductase subunit 2 [Equid gammaherpesvirus 5]UTK45575.1 ribonucleotide reductase subunit 2 [Equid gammaherpesvirus 5]UTK45654.1 ribonucleotide reductase subunit 2 [Equid gammaherpesvirus 5]
MDFVRQFLYSCDHMGFLALTQETWQNRWFPSQISLTSDVGCLQRLNREDLEFYKFLFSFLAMAEKLVNFNIHALVANFHSHDLEHYYTEQEAMENIHGKVYANILNMFFKNNVGEMQKYARAIVGDEALAAKLHWLHGRVAEANTRAEKVLVFLLIEGIFFISSFYSIATLRVRGLMNGVCMANDYISRDEWIHTRAAALLFNTLVPEGEKPSHEWIKALFREAVEVEHSFICAKGRGVSHVNVGDIRMFLEATADRILKSINVAPVYGTQPPPNCPLVYTGCLKNVNFFERESSDYTTAVDNDL